MASSASSPSTESNVAATASAMLAPLLIGGLAGAGLGWQAGIALTAPWAIVLWWTFRGVRFPETSLAGQRQSIGERLPPTFWLLCLVLFLVGAVEWCVAYWGAEFLAAVVGLAAATAAMAMALFFAAMAAGRLIGSRLVRYFPGTAVLLGAIAVALGGFLLFWLAASPLLSLPGLFIAGLGIANLYPLTVAAATGAAPHLIDQATARLAVATGVALLTAPLVVGAIADAAGLRWGFGIVVPLLVAAFAGASVATRRLDRDRAAPAPSLPAPPLPDSQ